MPRLIGPAEYHPDAAAVLADQGEVLAALRLLPRRQREVLVLRYYADLDATGCSWPPCTRPASPVPRRSGP